MTHLNPIMPTPSFAFFKNFCCMFFLLIGSSIHANVPESPPKISTIQDLLFKAEQGDYAVFSQGSKKIFVLVRKTDPQNIWLEISEFVSLTFQDKRILDRGSWKSVLHQLSSPRQISLTRFSLQQQSQIYIWNSKTSLWNKASATQVSRLLALLHLPLTEAPKNKIKLDSNHRPWKPRLFVEGKPTSYQTSKVYISTWPKDGSALEGNEVLLYCTTPEVSAFPLWISIDTPTGCMILKNIEMGHHATSTFPFPAEASPSARPEE